MKEASIIYYSASGNTAKIAGWIREALAQKEVDSHMWPIVDDPAAIARQAKKSDLLFLGTPTYMWHTPENVQQFVNTAGIFRNKAVGLFVTFGSVTVGANFSWLARVIRRQGGSIVGALKVEAEHAMMCKSGSPLAQGKPDENDKQHVREFVAQCLQRALSEENVSAIPGIMQYFSFLCPPLLARKFLPRLQYDPTRCELCGQCVKSCPSGNIRMTAERLTHGPDCWLCYNCVRVCPTGAIDANLEAMEGGLRLMSHLPDKGSAVF